MNEIFLISLVFSLVFAVCAIFLQLVAARLRRQTTEKPRLARLVIMSLSTPFIVLFWLLAALYGIDGIVTHFTGQHLLKELHTFVWIGVILTFGWFCFRLKKGWILHLLRAKKGWNHRSLDVLNKLGTLFIWLLVFLLVLEQLGANIKTLLALGGVGGIGVAFAAQQIISNFFGGLMIYFTQPFAVGEYVRIPDKKVEGVVEEIGWYMTQILARDQTPQYVPNAIFTNIVLTTPSKLRYRFVDETLHLRHIELDLLQEVMQEMRAQLEKHPGVNTDQPVKVQLDAFGKDAIQVALSVCTVTVDGEEFSKMREEILFEVARVLAKHQITLTCLTSSHSS